MPIFTSRLCSSKRDDLHNYDSIAICPSLIHLLISLFSWMNINEIEAWEVKSPFKMSSPIENAGIRRKSSSIAALMTLNCSNIPIINEPSAAPTAAFVSDIKKKAIRFDMQNTLTAEYDSEEVTENKRRITDEIKAWVHKHFLSIFSPLKFPAREFCHFEAWIRMEGTDGTKVQNLLN